MAINKDAHVTPCTVKREACYIFVCCQICRVTGALRVYFKSKKSQCARRRMGKVQEMMKECRKRQQRHNVGFRTVYRCISFFLQKSHARRKALVASRSIDDDTKKKVMEVLKPEFMSSEDSATENEEENESGSDESDNETPRRKQGKKKLIRHTLSWRNRECQNAMESLDRKLQRKRTPVEKLCVYA